ncbi:hypothetical protein C1X69_24475 [Pseudomonas sp. FW305-67]|nr:hypothetical protein C1X70_16695 [Pseudomonas sp. FW305-53]PMY84380.1 hypothetical protein C1X68_24845 [Pseudomonas sp. FW303-C2]PMY90028.1 hypothetical protein C1X67_25970 [Pseudomonas sp. FW305-62]PNA41366.1 hypothetical protein C1X71_19850 [Pseudomonas sp. FW306-2-2C-A10BC]PNA84285.1 hypothetical protein C1X66_21735 [Pseudomonas sp. MPR-R3B]PNB14784.1 hypothetical protein C1X69_24475 [Pseudomonas sp. FW305-67]
MEKGCCGQGACLWRGGLPPLDCAAVPKTSNTGFFQTHRMYRIHDCCAAEREQAPSPQGYGAAGFIANRHPIVGNRQFY